MRRRRIPFLLYALTIVIFIAVTAFGSRAVTTFSESAPIERQHCIIIDAGHGGEDGGTTSCSGMLESRFNLEIAVRLNDLLQFLGHETKMIRTTDISVYTKGGSLSQKKNSDLKERVRIVNETENGILLSIHQNHYSDSRYKGAQVFYAGTQGSEELAVLLQNHFVSTINPGSTRKSKKSQGIYLMEHIEKPGILIECGFLSNPEEEARLKSSDYQKKLCAVIAAAVHQFLSNT